MSEIKRCPSCKRSKRKAVSEQVQKRESCSFRERDCFFYEEIKQVLKRKKNIKIEKKQKKNIIIEKKQKSTVRIVKDNGKSCN